MKKKWLWTLLFFLLAVATIYIVTSNTDFSLLQLSIYLSKTSPGWIFAALLCTVGFILTEGFSLIRILKVLGCHMKTPREFVRGILYSSADIYVSGITPSATGGQPAAAYFMISDGVSPAVTTIALLLNLVFYTFSMVLIAAFCFIICPSVLFGFSLSSIILILLGALIQFGLIAFFLALIFKESLVFRLYEKLLWLLEKLHIIHHSSERLGRLKAEVLDYRACGNIIRTKWKDLIPALLWNIAQRTLILLVPVFVFLAQGGDPALSLPIFSMQTFVVLGANMLPIPGAIGISDYLFLDFLSNRAAGKIDIVSFELVSRTISFYFRVIICAIITLTGYIQNQFVSKKASNARSNANEADSNKRRQ